MRPLAAELPLWQIDICNLREAVTQHPPDGECRGGTQSIKHGLFRNNHFDVGAEDSFEAYWLKGSKCSIIHGRIQLYINNHRMKEYDHVRVLKLLACMSSDGAPPQQKGQVCDLCQRCRKG